jgi:VanZ family protein
MAARRYRSAAARGARDGAALHPTVGGRHDESRQTVSPSVSVRRRAWAWAAVAACVAVIWGFSSDAFSAVGTSRILLPLLRWLFPDLDTASLLHLHYSLRKGAHLTEYAVLGVLAFRAWHLSLQGPRGRLAALALGLVVAVAGVDELRQTFIPSRTGALSDVVLDSMGGALGLVLVVALQRWLVPPLAGNRV